MRCAPGGTQIECTGPSGFLYATTYGFCGNGRKLPSDARDGDCMSAITCAVLAVPCATPKLDGERRPPDTDADMGVGDWVGDRLG